MFPGFITYAAHTAEQQGSCYGFHLGSSANHRTRVELMADGRAYAQAGELLLPGEVILGKNESSVLQNGGKLLFHEQQRLDFSIRHRSRENATRAHHQPTPVSLLPKALKILCYQTGFPYLYGPARQ